MVVVSASFPQFSSPRKSQLIRSWTGLKMREVMGLSIPTPSWYIAGGLVSNTGTTLDVATGKRVTDSMALSASKRCECG